VLLVLLRWQEFATRSVAGFLVMRVSAVVVATIGGRVKARVVSWYDIWIAAGHFCCAFNLDM